MRCLLFGHRPVSYQVVQNSPFLQQRPVGSVVTICAECAREIETPAPPRGYEAVRQEQQ